MSVRIISLSQKDLNKLQITELQIDAVMFSC